MENYEHIEPKYYPAYVWEWNDEVTKEGIRERIDDMASLGIRAFYIIGAPSDFRPGSRTTDLSPAYLSEAYLSLLKYAADYAKSKNMYTWLYNEAGWPSGMAGGKVTEADPSCARLETQIRRVSIPAGTPYVPAADVLAAFLGAGRVRPGACFPTETELTEYVRTRHPDAHFSDIGNPKTAPVFMEKTYAPILSAFGDRIGRDVHIMFDDEPQMGTLTDRFDEKFSARFAYDYKDFLPFIFGEEEPKTQAQKCACADYHQLCGEIVFRSYFAPQKKYLAQRGLKFAGHLNLDHESDGFLLTRYGNTMNIFRSYEIPGIDVIWGQIDLPDASGRATENGFTFFPRVPVSAARQCGRRIAHSESFAVCSYSTTPEVMRFSVGYQSVRGINLYNFSCISYGKRGVRPLQFRPNFIGENVGTDAVRVVNEYTARLCYILQNADYDIRCALYYPFRTMASGGEEARRAKESFEALGRELEEKNVPFDTVDEDYVRFAEVRGGALFGEHTAYECVMVPDCPLEHPEIREKLAKCAHITAPAVQTESKHLRVLPMTKDGKRHYFLFAETAEAEEYTVTFPDRGTPYEIDLYTGKVYRAEAVRDERGRTCITKTVCGGDGVMLFFSEEEENAPSRPCFTGENVVLGDFRSRVTRVWSLGDGICNEYPREDFSPCALGPWRPDFSGEVVYETRLPDGIAAGEWLLCLGKVNHTVKVALDGEEIGHLVHPPYEIALPVGSVKGGARLTLTVANTPANACAVSDLFANSDPADVGPYHKLMTPREAKMPAGGLYGPVKMGAEK